MTLPAFFTDPRRRCKGSTLMWPEDARGVVVAVAICRPPGKKPCPFVDECLEYALQNGEIHHVWGGQSMRKRSALRKTQYPPRRRSQPKPGCRQAGRRLPAWGTKEAARANHPTGVFYECHVCGKWHQQRTRRAA